MRELVIGHDHGFGRGRSGDVETLRNLGAVLGFAFAAWSDSDRSLTLPTDDTGATVFGVRIIGCP